MPFPPYSPGLSNLRQMQNYVARQKPSYKTKKVGLLLTSMADLIAFSHAYSIPPTLALLNDAPSSSLVRSTVGDSLFIPMQAGAYGVHGACYTGKTQIGWIGQLAKMPGEWQVHLDGKYKLHHSQFLLFTLGTHTTCGTTTITLPSPTPLALLYISSAKRESQMEYVTL